MVAFNLVFVALATSVSAVVAAPTIDTDTEALRIPTADPRALLCKLPFIERILCPRNGGQDTFTVNTPLGSAVGTLDTQGARRFAVRYASASRWQPSSVATTWALPNGGSDVKAIPLACPQRGLESSAFSEDCLSIILYVPAATTVTGLPVMVWIPGGSFIVGSAGAAGINGSKLATATNSIVAVVQHRLGALGFMAPDGKTNLAVQDTINALKFLKTVLPSLGGNPNKITLAGQSSGGHMVRTLLATPSASTLFKQAIMQSDPMNYGFYKPSAHANLLTYFKTLLPCSATDSACLNGLSLSSIIDSEIDLMDNALDLEPSAGTGEPIRPVLDNTLITKSMTGTSKFPATSKPLLITSVKHEAGPAIYGNIGFPLPEEVYPMNCEHTFGADRTSTILSSSFYPAGLVGGSVDARVQLQHLGTDYLWKCSGWTFARNWAGNGGKAFVGLYTLGATYPTNSEISYCTDGAICHEDDIQIVFGTVTNPSSAQSALITEMQKRYKAFLATGSPNAAGLSTWSAASTGNVNVKNLGGVGTIEVGGCDVAFWGQAVEYDYQFYE